MTPRDTWTAWLGTDAHRTTDEQIDHLQTISAQIDADWPDPDDDGTRRDVLTGAAQVILGDDTLEGLAATYQRARQAERTAMDRLTGAIRATKLLDPRIGEPALAARAGVARMTARRALGRTVP